jgi:hypothetical protein
MRLNWPAIRQIAGSSITGSDIRPGNSAMTAGAEKYLRVARDELKVQHPLDADAAWLLGKINLERREWEVANSFYCGVLQTHLDSRVAPLAKIGRGVCRIALGNDEAGLSDLQDVVKIVREKDEPPAKLKEELASGLKQASMLLASNGNLDGAVEAMAYEQEVQTKVGAEFFERLGRLFERHADKLDAMFRAMPSRRIGPSWKRACATAGPRRAMRISLIRGRRR